MATGDDVTPASAKFTYGDLLNFRDDGKRREIIDGELYVTPSPSTKHQTVSMNLSGMLWTYLRDRPIGRVFAAPFDTVFSDIDVVEPDLLYVSRERLDVVTEKHVRGAPDLVVEILSPATRRTDEIIKRKLYERFGVREYWVVDPDLDAIQIYRRTSGSFSRAAELSSEAGDMLTTPVLPGFSALLTDVFAAPR